MARPPVAIVCVGMAGSGKTTFMQRINSYLYGQKDPPYVMNLDPAVLNVPFDSNIDIRDSVNYKEVMKQYNLGPNGGILTSLNLFTTKIDQILGLLEKRAFPDGAPPSSFTAKSAYSSSSTSAPAPSGASSNTKPISRILIDTPGQIEVFVWSASGDILLSSLASTFPTVIAYIVDTPRSSSTSTFMSNMLYAISILYKTKLPLILVFNKTDACEDGDWSWAEKWMTDFEAFQEALQREQAGGSFGGAEGGETGTTYGGGSGYMGSLLNSMSLVLEEFYRHLRVCGVSAMTGDGIKEFFDAVEEKREEFEKDYRPELEKRWKEREQAKEARREKELGRLMKDMDVRGSKQKAAGARKKYEPETVSDVEDQDDDQDRLMADDDDDDEPSDDDEDDDAGLKARYERALQEGRGNQEGDDMSFARYVAAANLNR
ncbi:MAG: hypothetical protein M1822_004010 [Bathelium mastoideum]|nr:MAG: hypothetical protein M1822_004010 [Bathelium mastoideum]